MSKANFTAYFNNKTTNNPLNGGFVNLSGNIGKDMENLNLSDNPEGVAAIGLTYAAAFMPGSQINKQFQSMDNVVVTGVFPRNYVPETNGNPATTVRGVDHANGNSPTYLPGRADESNYGDYGNENIAMCPDPEAVRLYSIVVRGNNDWKGHLYNLLGASEVKPLTAKHIKSYFAWLRSPNIDGQIIERILPMISSGMIKILDDEDLRGYLMKGKWMDYRTTFSTTGALLSKMLEECPEKYTKIFSDGTKRAIAAYEASKWDPDLYRAIPEKCLGVLYAYLLATDQMVDNLYGAKRSYEKFTLQAKESLSIFFKEAKSNMKVYSAGTLNLGGTSMPDEVWDI